MKHCVSGNEITANEEHATYAGPRCWRTMIRAYCSDARPGNGRGRKGGLPPGIAKNLQRGKPLPPGIAKQYFPHDLLARLPRAGDGLEYVVVAGKLLLVEVATQIVRKVLLDAIFD